MQNTLIALVVVFLGLFTAGLIVYAVFFAIHKKYFHKEIQVIKKYNSLISGLNGINIYKIQVLANNDIGDKLQLKKYITVYKKLKDNSIALRSNINIADVELNAFNLKIAKNYLFKIDNDLSKALEDLSKLKDGYDRYTQYGQAIGNAFQNYLDIYEAIDNFYHGKLEHTKNFKRINDLFASIKKTFTMIPELSIEFDYKKTVDTVLDLGRKLKTLANAILMIFKFQIIDIYLKTSKSYNEKMISRHFDEIARSDLQSLQNLLTLFAHAYEHFNQHYRNLELGKAKDFAVQAIEAINQINQFTYIHIKTPALIAVSISEIKEQTDNIILNKNEIVKSIRELKQYFVLEPELTSCFDTIEKDVSVITVLNNAANSVNYKTHTEKVRAIKELDSIAEQIVKRKTEIVHCIDNINDSLSHVIKTITDLNDLHVYFLQLLSVIKQFVPNGQERSDMESVIKKNITQIEEYLKQIVTNEKPDFNTIAYQISSIIEESQQIYKKMTTTVILKEYASKLFVYVNRYKENKQLADGFAKANKAYQSKNYSQCIDELIKIAKSAKKMKKKQ